VYDPDVQEASALDTYSRPFKVVKHFQQRPLLSLHTNQAQPVQFDCVQPSGK